MIISVTLGFPFVTVPVLSSTTVFIFPVFSRAVAVLNRIPFFAATPFPTIIATGVARPRAHGQLITSTDIPRASAYPASCPSISHITVVMRAIPITIGTKTPETLSAIFATGALLPDASSTMLIICERVVSSPTRVARHSKYPVLFTVPEYTLSPIVLSTGILSPVSDDSSKLPCPETISPSTGTELPGFSIKVSFTLMLSTDTVFSLFPSRMIAVLGLRFINDFKAFVVLPFALDSSILPTVMRVRIIAADSKYISCM